MYLTSSYSVHFKGGYGAIRRTVAIYNDAVRYLLRPVEEHWKEIQSADGQSGRLKLVEKLVHRTSANQHPIYDFDGRFYKFPSYLRRSAIMDAVGIVSAYRTSLKTWEDEGKKTAKPKMDPCMHRMPCFYNGNMFRCADGVYTAQIKVYRNRDWVWQEIKLSKTDVDYLVRRAKGSKNVSAPVLEKRRGIYKLRFAVKDEVMLSETPLKDRLVCAVDLGVTTDAVCSVIDSSGTVLSRRFIDCGREKDQTNNALRRVKDFQRAHGSHDVGRLWNIAKRRNSNHAKLVAHRIVDYAVKTHCDVIVFEHLDTKGKKHGSRRQRLAMWKHADIQKTAENLAHLKGLRVSRVCAWNTSKLAFDGTGEVLRGWKVSKTTPYDVCQFASGKTYNCDLSASYNIGARYFLRAYFKERPYLMAEVPEIGSGTRRTLSDLWKLNDYLSKHPEDAPTEALAA